eukprot:UN13786
MGCCSSSSYRYVLKVHVIKVTNLPTMDLRPTVDPYVKVTYDGEDQQTETIMNDKNPVFNQTLVFEGAEIGLKKFILEVWDYDRISANDLIGSCQCPSNEAREYNRTDELDFKLHGKKEQGRLFVKIRFMQIPDGGNEADYDDPNSFPVHEQKEKTEEDDLL